MDARAHERLQAFAQTTPDKRYVSADDVERFCALCIELHEAKLSITGLEIREALQLYGFDSYIALKLGLQFERYVQRLQQYSQSS